MKVRHLLTAFFAGELSPMLSGRVDSDQYRFGLDTCENFLPTIEGPLVKRPGFLMIRPASATAAWLTAFRYSTTQEYAVEWSELAARFYTNGGRIETDAVTPYEIVTPYSAAEAVLLSLQQSFDRQYLAHASHPPAALRRDSAIAFTLETLTLLDGPFADENGDDTITVSATGTLTKGGTVTLTATAAIFLAGHVGAPFRLEAKDFSTLKQWEPQMAGVTLGDVVRNDGKAYRAATGGATGSVMPTHTSGSEWDGQGLNDVLNAKGPYGVQWTYLYDHFGIATIASVASGTSADATVTRALPDSLSSVASDRWCLPAWSAAGGWPGQVASYKGRLVYLKDFDVVGSVVGDYGGGRVNFAAFTDSGTLADDLAFRRRLTLDQAPVWMARDRKLLVGTPTHEVAIGPATANAAFSGTNITADDQSFYGSEAIVPVQTGTETIFVEIGGRRIRAADYDYANDRYDAPDLTAAAGHITRGGIVQLAVQRTPYSLLHAVRGDGQIVVHPRSRADVKGFARTVLGGAARALSAVSIKGADGKTDELHVLVERVNGAGATVREHWSQAPWRDLGDAQDQQYFVDGGVLVAAAAGQTHFSGLDHLARQPVAVLCNGGVVPGLSVAADGTLDIPPACVPAARAFTVAIGLAYTATAVTLRPYVEGGGKHNQGVVQKVLKVLTRVLETVGIKLGVPGFEPSDVIDRPASARMDAPIPLVTGDVSGEVDAEFDKDGRATWLSEDPLAATVTLAVLDLEIDFEGVP